MAPEQYLREAPDHLTRAIASLTVELGPRQAFSVPAGMLHRPVVPARSVVLMIEKAGGGPDRRLINRHRWSNAAASPSARGGCDPVAPDRRALLGGYAL